MLPSFSILLQFEFLSERRKRHTVLSVFLYLTCLFFLLIQIHQHIPLSFGAVLSIFWVVELFIIVWMAFESFQSETAERMKFWYQYISVSQFFLVKCFYNVGCMLFITNFNWLLFNYLFLDAQYCNMKICILLSLATSCFVFVFLFIAYIVFILQKQMGLAFVLGLPLLLPQLLINSKIIKQLVDVEGLVEISLWSYIPIYALLSLMVIICGVYLLPFLKHS